MKTAKTALRVIFAGPFRIKMQNEKLFVATKKHIFGLCDFLAAKYTVIYIETGRRCSATIDGFIMAPSMAWLFM